MRRPTVLIFIVTDFGRRDGPVLWAANMLECVARIPDMNCVVVTSGPEDNEAANRAFTERLGLKHYFVPFRHLPVPKNATLLERILTAGDHFLNIALDKYYFVYERDARKQNHVDSVVMTIVKTVQPDLILVNSRNGALHVPSVFTIGRPCSFVALDNEIVFHRMYQSQVGPVGDELKNILSRWVARHGNWISNIRFAMYIDRLYKRCAGLVALTQSDIPANLPEHVVRAVIPPILTKSDMQWSYRGTRCILFVGNINVLKRPHVANRRAIEWICTRLSPALWRIDNEISITIIGANTNEVPDSWKVANVKFMGRSDNLELVRQMTTADLFIAPIANKMGAKLKMAECVSHGMPFLASEGAMSGLPFLKRMPWIDLQQPEAAARLVRKYVNDPEALTNLSRSILEQARRARAEQDMAWSAFLKCSMRASRRGVDLHAATSDLP